MHLLNKPLSYSIIVDAESIIVKNATIVLEDNTNVYYLEAKSLPKTKYRGNLLYLHGAAYSSHDWNRNKPSILQLSAAAGYRTIAIDLPGFGYSRTQSSVSFNKSAFMSSVIRNLNIHRPIIISPSASGSYAIPYVLKNADRIGGFIPVAPCCVHNTGWEQFTFTRILKILVMPGIITSQENLIAPQ
ncbi:Alpha/beta hydrolase domain-containing protein 14A [Dirofilaria immitis]|nr:Alpha/beta hydrolase domain-containing protein 14A [Dirofilaria immitis]